MASEYIMLDTCIISEAQKPRPKPEVSEWLAQLSPKIVAIPFPVIFETSYGIKLVEKGHPAKAQKLRQWLDGLLAHDFVMPVPTPAVAHIMAEMASTGPLMNYWRGAPEHERSSKLKFGSDPIIAATAIAHEMPIATMDVRDFMLIHHYFPLPGLYDPVSGEWVVDPPSGWSFAAKDNEFDHHETHPTGNVIRLRA
ncbi:PIN domain-containing protein [Neorhizobium galegae]|uniref:PIN domain-containing protein n=1 Tax=Neorhizobium galegae TaxID=399 RepID=UPI0021014149|nr:PIN domain-containing protein [Neorhizobium galegae]MCQ1572734.1 PIN domain-containing protein [Neorhizobium galegae]